MYNFTKLTEQDLVDLLAEKTAVFVRFLKEGGETDAMDQLRQEIISIQLELTRRKHEDLQTDD